MISSKSSESKKYTSSVFSIDSNLLMDLSGYSLESNAIGSSLVCYGLKINPLPILPSPNIGIVINKLVNSTGSVPVQNTYNLVATRLDFFHRDGQGGGNPHCPGLEEQPEQDQPLPGRGAYQIIGQFLGFQNRGQHQALAPNLLDRWVPQ